MSRVKLVELTKSYKNTDKLPYTEDDLALYLSDHLKFLDSLDEN